MQKYIFVIFTKIYSLLVGYVVCKNIITTNF